MNLVEAFKALNALNEDTFTISDDGINKLSQFEQSDDLTDEISVIDPEAETEDDFQDSYVGKVILDCVVCHSKLYKDKEEVEIDEEEQLANVGEECPYCYTSDGFKIIGEVSAFETSKEDEDDDEKDDEEPEVKSDEDEKDDDKEITESYKDNNGIMGKPGVQYSDDDYYNESIENDENLVESPVATLDRPMSKMAGTLGNVLTAHKDELFFMNNKQDTIDWLNKLEPEIKNKGYLDTVIKNIEKLPDFKVQSYLYDIILKGDGMGNEPKSIKEDIDYPTFTKKEFKNKLIDILRNSPKDEYNRDMYFYIGGITIKPLKDNSAYIITLLPDKDPHGNYRYVPMSNISNYVIDELIKQNIDCKFIRVGGSGRFTFSIPFELINESTSPDESKSIKEDKYTKNLGKRLKALATEYDIDEDLLVRDENGKLTTTSDNSCETCKELDYNESINESVNTVNVETDDSIVTVDTQEDGKVTVSTEAKKEESNEEVIAPVSDETKLDIEDNTKENSEDNEEVDVELDEFDEESFDQLGENYLKEIYENVNKYKTNQVSIKKDKLIVEGVIDFTSGSKKKTSFIFESKDCTKQGKLRFTGKNKHITEDATPFTLQGKLIENKFISESFEYNYKALNESADSAKIKGYISL